jgi:2-iminobutanoate/2-iminopropanoate deaminase
MSVLERFPMPSAGGPSISESVAVSGPGRWIHVSGQIPLDDARAVLGGPVREQVESVFDGLQGALERAGAALADVVKITVFVTDLGVLPEVDAVRAHRCADALPASSAVQVGALYGGAQLEIEAVAFRPEGPPDTHVTPVERP